MTSDRRGTTTGREDGDAEVALTRDLLRRHGLLPDIPAGLDADEDRAERLLASILDRAPAAETGATVTELHPRRRKPAHRRLTLAAAAAAAVGIVIVPQVLSGPAAEAVTPPALTYSLGEPLDSLGDALSSASPELRALAVVASAAPQDPPLEDAVQRVDTYSWLLEHDTESRQSVLYPTVGTLWSSPDGSLRSTQQRGAAVDFDGARLVRSPMSAAGEIATDHFGPGTFDTTLTTTLPRDPDALRDALYDQTFGAETCREDARTSATCLAIIVPELFYMNAVPDDLAASIWTVLAAEPEVRSLGTVSDRLGRSAVAVAVAVAVPGGDSPSTVTVLLISPETGQLLGSEEHSAPNSELGLSKPAVTGFTTLTRTSQVAEIGD